MTRTFARAALALTIVSGTLLATGTSANTPSAAAAIKGPCGELERLPGPGHYSGGFKGTLVRLSPLGEMSVPLGGTLELDIDETGGVDGRAESQFSSTPQGSLGGAASGNFDMRLDGQLSEPLGGSDIPGQGQFHMTVRVPMPFGRAPGGYDGPTTIHFKGWERNVCAAVLGTWSLDNVDREDPSGRWELRDAIWGAKLVGFDEGLEREVRGTLGVLINLPPNEALGLPLSVTTAEADALLDALASGAVAPPAAGPLFGLYRKVEGSGGAPGQVRCLLDLIRTVTSGKLQQYIAGGAQPAFEETGRFGYAVRLLGLGGATAECAAFAGGRDGLRQLMGGVLQAMTNTPGADLDRVARLTRAAGSFGFDEIAAAGTQWLKSKGYPI